MPTTTPESTKPEIPAALAQFNDMPDAAYVRAPVVAGLYGISLATVWRWVKTGRLPAATRLGPNTTGWQVGALRQNQRARG